MDLILNIFLAVLSTYTVFEYFRIFFELKYNSKKISLACFYGTWQVFSMAITSIFPAWLRLIISIIFVITIGFCFYGDFWGKIVFAVIYNAVWMVGELLIGVLFLTVDLSIVKYEILGSILSKILLILLVKLLQCFFRHDSVSILSWKDNALLMALPVGSMFLTYHLFMLSYKMGAESDVFVSFLAFLAILIINIVMFAVYIKLSDSLEVKHENSIYQLEINLYNEHIKEKEAAMSEFRKSKHDLKNKLIFLLDLLRDKKYGEMEEYIKDLVDLKSLEGFTVAHSDNSLIDALVNYKYETAKEHGIRFSVKLDIPVSFSLANSDLCVILGNALDNAIEANIGKDIINPFIDLKMKYIQNNLIIILENSFDGNIKMDEKGKIVTRKQDNENHGIGLTSISKALVKYNGFMDVEINDKKYKLTIIMHNESKK